MKVVADLQLHSKYSRAVSDKLTIHELYYWSQVKGINLIATGDWTHPLWLREIENSLDETRRGTLTLKKSLESTIPHIDKEPQRKLPNTKTTTEFLLATELSSIYKQGGKSRRVHNLVWVPTLKTAKRIIEELEKRGCNLRSDGRPIIGLPSKEVLELVSSIDEKSIVIPAHAWTPWFALYGSKSGFDSIKECFEDMSNNIYAIETGLSSDPVMNWRIKDLDNRNIVSFSDAHSGPKLGREATVFELEELSYENIRSAISSSRPPKADKLRRGSQDSRLQENNKNTISCTFEFYPEEGKYHFDGHRKCQVRQTPEQTRKRGTQCPVCGRPLTVGVEYRVEELAGRDPVNPIVKLDKYGVKWQFHPDPTYHLDQVSRLN